MAKENKKRKGKINANMNATMTGDILDESHFSVGVFTSTSY